jgi:OOP family OmpA-OmpF porin
VRARAIAVVVPVVIGVALAPSRARAAGPTQTGFALDTFEPSARGSDWFVLDSLDFRGDSRGAVGTVYEYADKPFVVKNAGGGDRAAVVQHQLYVHAGASFVIQDRVRLSVDLPIALVDTGTTGTFNGYTFPPPGQAALGDTPIAADLRLFGRYGELVTGTFGAEVIAPSGTRAQYTGDGKTRFLPRFQIAGVFRDLAWAARVGVLLRTGDDPIAGQTRGDAFVFGASLGWRPKQGRLVVGPEIYGSASLTEGSAANTPLEALLGAHYAFAEDWRVGLGVGPGLTSAIGTPTLRAALSIEFVAGAASERKKPVAPPPPPDKDGDGIQDSVDACPSEKGVPNTDPESNGCPPDEDEATPEAPQ